MTNAQALIIAAGIALAGLFNGGIWSWSNESALMLNRFTGKVATIYEARGSQKPALFGVPAD